MGLLSRLTAGVTPQKKASDEVLLLHGMLLMCSSDGAMEDEELDLLQGFYATLPEFRGKDFGEMLEQCNKAIAKYPNLRESVKALSDITNDKIKLKCYILAADIARSAPGAPWRTWTARRVATDQRAPVTHTLADLRRVGAELRARLAKLDELEHLIVAGTTAGTLTIIEPEGDLHAPED